MAVTRELARGSVEIKNTKGWAPAELFWEARTSDPANHNEKFTKWNEGTLWLGRPSLNGESSPEKAIPIAGSRINNGLVYRGDLYEQQSIEDELFNHAHEGDFYIFKNDAKAGVFHETDDFRKDDILLIISIGDGNVNLETGNIIDHSLIQYRRVNNSGGYADDVYFKDGQENWYQWSADNVQDALLETQVEKLEYVKEINDELQIPNPELAIVGGLYLITKDDINFNKDNAKHDTFRADKGDFVFYTADGLAGRKAEDYYWHHIPSGYTDAADIDYYNKDNEAQFNTFLSDLYGTFSTKHKDAFKEKSKNVHSALDFLMANKAQLDEQGKVPLSQLHDTLIGGVQYKGTWKPIKDGAKAGVDYQTQYEDTKTIFINNDAAKNVLPGYGSYEDGDAPTEEGSRVPHSGDYYIVSCPIDVVNLQYDKWELNTGDWIIFNNSPAQDYSDDSLVIPTPDGYWSVIDNSERLTQLTFRIDTRYDDNFWTEPVENIRDINMIANPRIIASHKIGIVKIDQENTVEIVGKGLVDQKKDEHSKVTYYPRYSSTDGTIENAFAQDEINTKGLENVEAGHSNNVTRFWSNVEIGKEGVAERKAVVHGNVIIKPHISSSTDLSPDVKSFADFVVNVGGDSQSHVYLSAQDGSTSYGIKEDKTDPAAYVMLPEHTSTIVGKLAGIEFQSGRITKSVNEGYIETSSIEEHINDDSNTSNFHDSCRNIVEFHSQVSTPKLNMFEANFGKYRKSSDYTEDDFRPDGGLALLYNLRLTSNNAQTSTNVNVLLPADSGTLFTHENYLKLQPVEDNAMSYLAFWGKRDTLDDNKVTFPTLQKSPIQLVNNALMTRLQSTNSKNNPFGLDDLNSHLSSYTTQVKEGKYEPTVEADTADVVVNQHVVAGKFNDKGELVETKSIFATKSLGVGNNDTATGFIYPARTNFPNAPQYKNPYNGVLNPVTDVRVDMPNESGVLLTSNSVIDGGLYISEEKQ